MILKYPEVLWMLFAMIIPIIIHLVNFRKNKKIYFSDIRFLKQVKKSSSKPLKIRQWGILISRLFFLLFLIIMFAQPIIPLNTENHLKKGKKLIYIDNSQSMNALINSKETAIESAKSVAQNIINKLPSEEEIIIVNNTNINQFFTTSTLSEASQKISAINLSDKSYSLAQIGTAISNYRKRTSNLSDVFIISDFQKTTSQLDIGKLDTSITYWLSVIKAKTINNCIVDSLFVVTSNINSGSNVEVKLILSNKGETEKENLPVKIFIGNRQVSAATVTIPSYQKKTISFSLGKVNQIESGYIQIEDYPNTFDNIFYFSLPKKRKLTVLNITEENSSPAIKNVFGNSDIFSVFSSNILNINQQLLKKTDFIVLNQINDLGASLIQQLKVFAKKGGRVLVIPGIDITLTSYHELIASLKKNIIVQNKKIQSPSSENPFFSTILERSSEMLKMPNIDAIWSWEEGRSAILSFEDGSPYLSEISNNIYFISTPLIDSISNFQSHALFVPIMYSLASQVATPTSPLFSRIKNDYHDIKIDSIGFNSLIKLSKDKIEIIPDKIKIGNKWRFFLPKEIITTGNYSIELNNKLKGYLSINLNKEESSLQPFSELEIRTLLSAYRVNFLEDYSSRANTKNIFDTEIDLWKYALVICLLFLFLETLFIRFL